MDLKITLGTVNYTDYLHVIVSKVSDPTTVIWEDWIDVPVTNYAFVVPNLDPDNYYVAYYDAPTTSDLGTLVGQCFVSALSPQYEFETRFYPINNLPSGATLSTDGTTITDTYLIDKEVTEFVKENFRPLIPTDEIVFDNTVGSMALQGGTAFYGTEVFMVTIRNAVGTSAGNNGGALYTGTLDVSAATATLSAGDKNKRIRCVGTANTQVLTLPALAALSDNDGYYIDNCCGGTAQQVTLVLPGTDKIQFSGLETATGLFAEFWVSKGEHLLIRKYGTYWEIITDYKGVHVGERFAATYLSHPNTLPEDGRLLDATLYPRLAWWLENVLPASHKIIDNTITSLAWSRPSGKNGLFAVTADYSYFRMPNTQGLVDKGLANYTGFGTDTTRSYDYPGGYQADGVKDHQHEGTTGTLSSSLFGRGLVARLRGLYNGSASGINDLAGGVVDSTGTSTGTTENRVKNNGVVFLRRV